MIAQPDRQACLDRVRRMSELYQQEMITESSLFGAVLDAIPSVAVEDLVTLIPSDLQVRFRDWVRGLPDADYKGIVYWPVPRDTTIALKNWLTKSENGSAIPG